MTRRILTYPYFLLFFLTSGFSSFAQDHVQVVRGQVVDITSAQPLAGAKVSIGEQYSISDEMGAFRLDKIPTGRHELTVQLTGYRAYSIPDLVLDAGKEKILTLRLEERVAELDEVIISAENQSSLRPVSTRAFTIEETQRFAATYYDPARLALSFPGVSATNDQANHISVRGNSPNGLLWRLEGIDIVNPNHTINAGTNSDRVSQNGGGVIMLSTQLMASSSFSTGAFEPQYGNALSGVFDIRLRKGNDEHKEFTVQAGLIGIDVAAEGPISKNSRSSFLVNYRYSTVGLLSAMGVDLGDEAISYQDLSFNLNFPTEKAGTFTIFGMGGTSSNLFAGSREDSTWEVEKDRFDIEYRSQMGAIGATHTLLLGTRTLWRSVLAASGVRSKRTGDYIDNTLTAINVEADELNQGKISLNSSITHKLNARQHLEAGFYLTHLSYTIDSKTRTPVSNPDFTVLAEASGGSQLIQPYVNWIYRPGPRWSLRAGLHAMYFALNNTASIEPRAEISYAPSPRSSLSAAYGLHSQLQLLGTYFATVQQPDGSLSHPNESLGFTKAHHIVLSYNQQLGERFSFKLEPYYQRLFRVPIVEDPTSTFSALNLVEGYVTDSLVNKGTGENYGLELTLEKRMSRGYYLLLSSAAYESTYTGGDGVRRDTRFNGNFAGSASGGREFRWAGKRQKDRIVGINLRMIYQGGYHTTPIDLAGSATAGTTVYVESAAFSERQKDYFRSDLRISFKRHKARYTRTFSFDIQNLTNRENVAFSYYDTYQQKVVVKNQLGIIPLMSYRLDF